MGWLKWHLEPHHVVIFAAAIIAVAFAAVLFAWPSSFDGPRGTNNGFGPDWECTSHPMSEPTCIKKLQH
jgi:hypothetical protein